MKVNKNKNSKHRVVRQGMLFGHCHLRCCMALTARLVPNQLVIHIVLEGAWAYI